MIEAIHCAARGLHRVGTIDKATMREFDKSCLTSPPVIAPEEIKRIREGAHVSQPVFARYRNTGESTYRSGKPERSGQAAWRSSCWPWLRSTDSKC